MDPSVRGFIGPDHPAAIALRDLESDFGSDALTQVVLEGDVFSAPFLEQLRSLHAELEKIDIELPSSKAGSNSASEPSKKQDSFDSFGDAGWGDEAGGSVIDEVVSLVNARKTEWRDGGLQVGGLMDSWPSEGELPALRERVMTDASMVGWVVGHAGRHAVISVRAHNMPEADRALVFDEVERISRRYQTDTIRVRVGGPAGLNAYLARLIESDFGRLIGVGMLVIVAVVVVLFRHPLGIVGPALVVAKSALWTLGAMAFFGAKVTMMTNILPLLDSGLVRLGLKRAYSDGTVAVDMDPLSLLCRLAASVPGSGFHTVRYGGVPASAAQWRPLIVPPPEPDDGAAQTASAGDASGDATVAGTNNPPTHRSTWRPWPELLKRTFAIDLLCPSCGGPMKLNAFLTSPQSLRRLLTRLGEPTEALSRAPARGPPYFATHAVRRHTAEPSTQAELFDEPA